MRFDLFALNLKSAKKNPQKSETFMRTPEDNRLGNSTSHQIFMPNEARLKIYLKKYKIRTLKFVL